MKIVGIVAEYNPFHAGHRHHIAETRRRLGPDWGVAAVMSGHFVQRGDCAICDKWSRARAALAGGADLVVELPTVWAASSAEHFASGALALLQMLGAEALSFGSESGDADALRRAAEGLDGPDFRAALRRHLDRGLPFALCRQRAAEELLGERGAVCLSRPNDNLGVEYLRAAARLGFGPHVVAVPRIGAGHDGGAHPLYPSASHLRGEILRGERPMDNPASLQWVERAILARLRAMEPEELEKIPDSGEGLALRLHRAARQATGLEELYGLAKTKRYAHARIRRMVLWAWLGLEKGHRPERPPYVRVLGCTGRGREMLRQMQAPVPVVTKPTQGKGIALLEQEARCTDLYALCRETPQPAGAEWATSPVVL